MIRRSEFARTLAFVEDSGAATDAEALLRPAGHGGRPRQIAFSVFFAAVILAAQESKNLSLVRVHKLLTSDLARSYQIALNIIATSTDGTQRTLTLRQVRYMLEALERKLAHTQGRAPDLDDADRALRKQALQNIMDMLIDATIPAHLPMATAFALDGTAVESWARGKTRRKVDPGADHAADAEPSATNSDTDGDDAAADGDGSDERISFDPDAAWGYRTKTYDNKSSFVFGYHAFAMVGVRPVGACADSAPTLVERLTLSPANANAAEPALALVDSLRASGRDVQNLLSDREFSYKNEVDWAAPLRDRGVAQVIDMHEGDRGVRDYNGVAMIDGAPHCKAVLAGREDLIRIQRPATLSAGALRKNATDDERREHAQRQADIDTFRAGIAERSVAAFRRVAGPNANGDERWECPAQAGKVICPNCPLSLDYPDGVPVVETPHEVPALAAEPVKPAKDASREIKDAYREAKAAWNAEADFLRCCRQRTVTIPGHVSGKLRQKHLWGSDPWIEDYTRRTHAEGFFGNIKSDKTTGVKRGWIYVVGFVKTSLMLLAAAVASNIRQLRKWADHTGDRAHALCAEDPEHYGFEELDADGNPDLAHAPPEAA